LRQRDRAAPDTNWRAGARPCADSRPPNAGELAAKLPGKALDHRGAFHVPAEQAEGVGDAIPDDAVASSQEVNCLDEARDADNRVSARSRSYFFEHLRKLDRVVARLRTAQHRF